MFCSGILYVSKKSSYSFAFSKFISSPMMNTGFHLLHLRHMAIVCSSVFPESGLYTGFTPLLAAYSAICSAYLSIKLSVSKVSITMETYFLPSKYFLIWKDRVAHPDGNHACISIASHQVTHSPKPFTVFLIWQNGVPLGTQLPSGIACMV